MCSSIHSSRQVSSTHRIYHNVMYRLSFHNLYAPTASGFLLASYPYFSLNDSTSATYFSLPSSTIFCHARFFALPLRSKVPGCSAFVMSSPDATLNSPVHTSISVSPHQDFKTLDRVLLPQMAGLTVEL